MDSSITSLEGSFTTFEQSMREDSNPWYSRMINYTQAKLNVCVVSTMGIYKDYKREINSGSALIFALTALSSKVSDAVKFFFTNPIAENSLSNTTLLRYFNLSVFPISFPFSLYFAVQSFLGILDGIKGRDCEKLFDNLADFLSINVKSLVVGGYGFLITLYKARFIAFEVARLGTSVTCFATALDVLQCIKKITNTIQAIKVDKLFRQKIAEPNSFGSVQLAIGELSDRDVVKYFKIEKRDLLSRLDNSLDTDERATALKQLQGRISRTKWSNGVGATIDLVSLVATGVLLCVPPALPVVLCVGVILAGLKVTKITVDYIMDSRFESQFARFRSN